MNSPCSFELPSAHLNSNETEWILLDSLELPNAQKCTEFELSRPWFFSLQRNLACIFRSLFLPVCFISSSYFTFTVPTTHCAFIWSLANDRFLLPSTHTTLGDRWESETGTKPLMCFTSASWGINLKVVTQSFSIIIFSF
jgi:hypothetical protein